MAKILCEKYLDLLCSIDAVQRDRKIISGLIEKAKSGKLKAQDESTIKWVLNKYGQPV